MYSAASDSAVEPVTLGPKDTNCSTSLIIEFLSGINTTSSGSRMKPKEKLEIKTIAEIMPTAVNLCCSKGPIVCPKYYN